MSFPFPRPPIRVLWRSAADALKAPWPHEVFLPFRISLARAVGRVTVEAGIHRTRDLSLRYASARLHTGRVLIGHTVAHYAAKVCDFRINPLPLLLRAPLRTRISIQVRINIGGRISTACRPFQRSNGEPREASVVHLRHYARPPHVVGRSRLRTLWASGLFGAAAPREALATRFDTV